jgi:hypothetical protein
VTYVRGWNNGSRGLGETGKPVAPPWFLPVVTAIPGVRGRAARSNAHGPDPPALRQPRNQKNAAW